jgi:hypothetical protein
MFDRLPADVRVEAVMAYRRFLTDPSHRSLRHHALKENRRGSHRPGSFSVSINRNYRAIYLNDAGQNVWYWVGSHSEFNRFAGDSE